MPVPISPQSRAARARLGQSTMRLGPNSAETIDARRDYAAERLSDYIRDTLAKAPPLSDHQRTRLAELLKPVREAAQRPEPELNLDVEFRGNHRDDTAVPRTDGAA